MSSSVFYYEAKDNAQSGNPGSGHILWNNVTMTASTQININHLTDTPVTDIDIFLALLQVGQQITIQDQNDSGNYQVWTITGATTQIVGASNYWEVPVSLVSAAGTAQFPNNHKIILATLGATGSSGSSGTSGTSGTNGTSGSSGITPATYKMDISCAISDESTQITTGTEKLTIYAPYDFTITEVQASLSTSGSTLSQFDVNINGTSIFSTNPTIDANENSTGTAATPSVLSTTTVTKYDRITYDIDTAGAGARGAKIYIVGTRAI